MKDRSRWIEDGLAIAGILQALFFGTLEALRYNGITFGTCTPVGGIPWVTLWIFAGCVLPKTLGRATGGRIWDILARRRA